MEDVRLLSSVCLPLAPQTTLCSAGVTTWCFIFYFFLEEQVIQALPFPCYIVSVILSKHKTTVLQKKAYVCHIYGSFYCSI